MKILNKLFTGLLFIIVLGGCDPSLVDAPPLSGSEDNYFEDVNEFEAQLTSAYASLYDYYHYAAPELNTGGWPTGTWLLPGDDLTETEGARTSVELFDGTLNANNETVTFVFNASYKMINRANVTIEKVRTIDYSEFLGAERIDLMEGEALFLRAWGYYKLFNTFGSVPLVTKRLQTQEETNVPKSPPVDILTQVIEDTQRAIEVLPENWDQTQMGRVTKNAARGLLTKALVFRGNYTGNMGDYQEAFSVYNSITAELVPDYIDNFSAFTENNEESLFEVQAGVANNDLNNLILHNDGPWRGVENSSVFRGYMMEFAGRGDLNDQSSTKFLITKKLLNNFGDDPRISAFLNPDDEYDGRIFQKYNKPDSVNVLTAIHGGSANNERVLRYADLILIAAEAALKTGDHSTAVELINRIRTRARNWGESTGYGDGINPADHSVEETDRRIIMQWIMDERFVELAGEGQRWYDLKRWHVAGDIDLSGWNGSEENFSTAMVSPVQFDVNKHLVFPLPQSELERNSAINENNPGY